MASDNHELEYPSFTKSKDTKDLLTYEQSKDSQEADDRDEHGVIGRVALELLDQEEVGDLSVALAEPVQEVDDHLKQNAADWDAEPLRPFILEMLITC